VATPDWTPQTGPGRPRALDELLAPNVLDAICAAVSALPRSAAVIAAQHARLVTAGTLDLYSANRAQRPEGEGRRYYPLQPAQRAEFAAGYQAAAHASKTAATSLAPLARGYEALKTAALTRAPQTASRPGLSPAQRMQNVPRHPNESRSVAPRR
jgi:hypothetical protein